MASAANPRIYLDYNATAPLLPQARAAALAALDCLGNPSSIHAEGRAARAIVEDARRLVGAMVSAPARSVVFTSGGTEAANLVLTPAIRRDGSAPPLTRLILGAGEHPCMLRGHRFPPQAISLAPLDAEGRLNLEALAALIAGGEGAPMLALQGANNETGVVQPVGEAAAVIHAAGGVLVCDAVQLPGRANVAEATAGADFIILSAHKFGGPKGVGALIATRPELALETPLLRGGGQERGARAGTENVAAIAGFGAAAHWALSETAQESVRLATLRDRLTEAALGVAPEAKLFGAGAPRLANTVALGVPGVDAAMLVIALDLAGAAVSSGSACSSGKVAPSHVLAAMGVAPELAAGAIRLSLGWASGEADIDGFASAFAVALAGLRRRHGTAGVTQSLVAQTRPADA
ncbi:MAG: cysteine desulfurase [Bradyrhizobium sp.]|nr:MAG: cysteine desulfurase [Bradyrhizobium sp.]